MTPREYLGWRHAQARYWLDWWLVNQHGIARVVIAVVFMSCLLPVAYYVDYGSRVEVAVGSPVVQKAWVQFFIYLAIMIVAAIVAYAMAPKPKAPEPGKGQIPEADDGKSVIQVFGDVWVEDPMVIGFKPMGTDPIKAKGGK